jgi:hypothetical protein
MTRANGERQPVDRQDRVGVRRDNVAKAGGDTAASRSPNAE